MAGSQLQNVQRGLIFMWLGTLSMIGTMLVVKLIKKRIDYRHREGQQVEANSAVDKYKQKDGEVTQQNFEETAVKESILTDDDTCVDRMMKKACEFNTNICPLLMVSVLAFIAGKSYGFTFTFYMFGIVFSIVFNIFKVHRAFIDFYFFRWFIQILFPLCTVVLAANLLVGESSPMMYLTKQG